MSQKGREVLEDIGDTSPLSLLQKGPTLKGACSCSNPTTTKKNPERGASGHLRTPQGIITPNSQPGSLWGESLQGNPQVLAWSWGQQVWGKGLS